MDLKKELERIKDHLSNLSDEDFFEMLKDCGYGRITPTNTFLNTNDWINVNDHLPKINHDVLCYRGNHIGGMKDVYTYKGMNIWEDSYGYFQTTEDEGITHWMELPLDPYEYEGV
jgi:hypothetical protein